MISSPWITLSSSPKNLRVQYGERVKRISFDGNRIYIDKIMDKNDVLHSSSLSSEDNASSSESEVEGDKIVSHFVFMRWCFALLC